MEDGLTEKDLSNIGRALRIAAKQEPKKAHNYLDLIDKLNWLVYQK